MSQEPGVRVPMDSHHPEQRCLALLHTPSAGGPQKLRPCPGPGYVEFVRCLPSHSTDLLTATSDLPRPCELLWWPRGCSWPWLLSPDLVSWFCLGIAGMPSWWCPCPARHPQLQAPCLGRDASDSCCSLTPMGNDNGAFPELGSKWVLKIY